MNFFNRRELITTYNLKQQDQIRDILRANGIEFCVKTANLRNSCPLPSGTRGHTGAAFEKAQHYYNYKIYVHKDDLEEAERLIRGE